jgi:hypothetical protein
MRRNGILAAALFLVLGLTATGSELVKVPGSSTQFTRSMSVKVGEKQTTLVLTGVALREKFFVNVYALASYVQEGVSLKTAEDLAAADVPKQLHLVMERTVSGKDMAEALVFAIRQNHPEPAFTDEVNRLNQLLCSDNLEKGDHIYLTHLPGVGLRCTVVGKTEFVIANPEFSRAVWDIYLGKNNVGEGIKKGLVSRL